MTYDMRQPTPKLSLISMIAALALSLPACDQPPSGDSIGRGFDKSTENVRQDLDQAENHAGRPVEKSLGKTDEMFAEAGRAPANIALVARVKAALIEAPTLDSSKIDVGAATNGVVTLTGSAEDATKRALAERLALGVEGVTVVRNNITVARGS